MMLKIRIHKQTGHFQQVGGNTGRYIAKKQHFPPSGELQSAILSILT